MMTMLVKVVTLGTMKANSLCRSQTEVAGDSDDEDHPEPVEEPAGKSRSWSPTHSVGHQVESNL